MNADALHAFYDIVSLLGVVGAAWVGLLIKNALYRMESSQDKVKADLLASQVEMKEDLTEKHSENVKNLAVHTARDEEQFASVKMNQAEQKQTLARIEAKIDRANGFSK